MIIYLLKGHLPWQGKKGMNKKTKKDEVYEMKKEITMKELCSGLPAGI
jgi:hypothetical protein